MQNLKQNADTQNNAEIRKQIPDYVQWILQILEEHGFEAWCVGGCVRDILRGLTPHDWDVTTNALPQQVMSLFHGRAFPTGLQHGTVTIAKNHAHVEVTTFRCDGAYQDFRHPSSVTFTRSLSEDLRRRDFTVNAMAMNAHGQIFDPFGGQRDLQAKVLRCVGSPDERFHEDALRLMRGLRFAAVHELIPDTLTAESIHRNRELLSRIAPERIREELLQLLCGVRTTDVLRQFPDVISVFWPEITDMLNVPQHNPWHCCDLWEHTLHALDAAEQNNVVLRCTMLLHDVGKPRTFTMDEQGTGHFYRHGDVGCKMADAMLRRLKCSNAFRSQVVTLVEWHDRPVEATEKSVRRALAQLGEETFRLLLAVKRADNLAQAEWTHDAVQRQLDDTQRILEHLIHEKEICFTLRQLAVNGHDMMETGFHGREIGTVLNELLNRVIDGELSNERETLLSAARERYERSSADGN